MKGKIRSAESTDAKAIKEIYECEHTYTGTLQLPYPSIATWEKRVSNVPENVYQYVALLDGEIVGHIGFEICKNPRRRHVGSFGMGVKDHVQGRGVGSQLLTTVVELSDKWLNLRRLEVEVYADNERAINLYKKFGFQIEGESVDYAFRNGKYVNVYHMARVVKNV
ncbi:MULTISPECIES: GNAT family N-acetyltransferase [Vibrio]|uniref:Spermidine N(1)-acetyltransferase n=3 Tax=Vibrio TaxID=662 RepID=A0A1N6LZJ0_9VIBR|nr:MULTISPECIES: GNAT family N-acetyltransferase [Vibrio]ASA57744.1 GNAT family N-acetyltransferase [Vibrio gazogenes]USP15625.1 GNAT family N-acetyltransferase [Vibrio gazogenes]SHE63339.1 putative acetyltransferase [Vibrio gazogenes DSM 21264] [Vibrio gazogenes DSM 21264 = NBRC 103151]SIO92604.1 Spermidine N(1)-acetyltransferase [Vibrio spartinae]SJN54655.1 Spermidine N(1)-acetyltransferase [Vibrio gazogenes]